MCRDRPTVEQARVGEYERTDADAHHDRPPTVCLLQRDDHALGRALVVRNAAGHDDDVGVGQSFQAP